jgi:hypothetical protein
MRVSKTAHWLEWQDWANPILQQPYEVKDGKLHIPDVPGADWNGMRRRWRLAWLITSRPLNSFAGNGAIQPVLGRSGLREAPASKNEIVA